MTASRLCACGRHVVGHGTHGDFSSAFSCSAACEEKRLAALTPHVGQVLRGCLVLELLDDDRARVRCECGNRFAVARCKLRDQTAVPRRCSRFCSLLVEKQHRGRVRRKTG